MYFSHFPKIIYDANGTGQFKGVTNLLRRVAVRSKVKENTVMYDTYDVQEGETPESIADKLYDDPEKHWIVLMMNDITDRYQQWPMAGNQFLEYINDKYQNDDGTSNVDGVHHYEIAQSSGNTKTKIEVYADSALYVGDTDFYSTATTITNREYEEEEQDRKRKIRLLDPSYVDQFEAEFSTLMRESLI
jgi:hypothetical protein|tara:strand:- start:2770 stop:3336 length:567 start_codon:yes stop_codon:yes gene_type:complete